MNSDKQFLTHIEDEINFILEHTTQLSFEEFDTNVVIKKAVERSLEIIGEAVKNLSKEFKEKNDQIEWKAIAGTRDRLIHKYMGVDHELVWDIIQTKLPELLAYINKL